MQFYFKLINLLLILATCALVACTAKPKPPLVIGSNNWLGYQPLFLSEKLNFFQKKEISLLKLGSSSEVIRGFRNNVIDAATLTLDETINLTETESDLEIILVMDISHGADAIVAREPIRQLSDLKSKTVGVEKTALGAYMLSRALELGKLSEKDIKTTSIEFDQHKNAFLSRDVDAIVTFDPVKTLLQKNGANIIFDSSDIPGEIVDVLVVRRSLDEHKKEYLQKLVNSWFKALQYINNNHEEADPILADLNQLSLSSYRKARFQIRLPDRENVLNMLSGQNASLPKQIRKLKQVMSSYQKKALKTTGPAINTYYLSHLE